MEIGPIEGTPVRFPPGKVAIRLGPEHRRIYRDLYARYQSILAGLPVLRDRDFDGRKVLVSVAGLEALNKAFAGFDRAADAPESAAFASQEASRSGLFKRLQYLS